MAHARVIVQEDDAIDAEETYCASYACAGATRTSCSKPGHPQAKYLCVFVCINVFPHVCMHVQEQPEPAVANQVILKRNIRACVCVCVHVCVCIYIYINVFF